MTDPPPLSPPQASLFLLPIGPQTQVSSAVLPLSGSSATPPPEWPVLSMHIRSGVLEWGTSLQSQGE